MQRPDLLVNNAGMQAWSPLLDLTDRRVVTLIGSFRTKLKQLLGVMSVGGV